MARCAFLGLGVMGYPMAGHLAAAGHDVIVWNRTVTKAEKWAGSHAGQAASTLNDAVAEAEFVFMCLGDDPDVQAIADQIIPEMAAGRILVDHTTASAELARSLYAVCAASDIGFIDAPVSGGQAGAENGQLAIMCGGDDDVFARVEPVMDAYAKAITLIGEAGAGQLAKMVNQICIAGMSCRGFSEGPAFCPAGRA